MSTSTKTIQELTEQEYKYGFVTDIEAETIPRGLSEDVIRTISAKKGEPEFMLEWRLKAYRHWLTMKEPTWHNVHYPPIDYQAIIYYSAPKTSAAPKSLDEVDPELLKSYAKLGIPLSVQKMLAGVAVEGIRHLEGHDRTELGTGRLSAHRLPGHPLLRRAEEESGSEKPGRGGPGGPADLRKAWDPPGGAETV